MSYKKPLVLNAGGLEQIQSIDDLNLNYQSESVALFTRITDISLQRRVFYDYAIKWLKDKDIWGKLDLFYYFAGENQQQSLLNWKSNDFDCNIVNDVYFLKGKGFKVNFEGTPGYLDTGWNPTDNAEFFSQDKASFGVYCRDNIDEDTIPIGTNDGANGGFFIKPMSSGLIVSCLNNSTFFLSVQHPYLNSEGWYVCDRPKFNEYHNYINNLHDNSSSTESVGLSTLNVFILAVNNGGIADSYSHNTISCAYVGESLSEQEHTSLYTIIKWLNAVCKLTTDIDDLEEIKYTLGAGSASSDSIQIDNKQLCKITTKNLTTYAGALYTITLISNKILATSNFIASIRYGTCSQGIPIMVQITPSYGSVDIQILNQAGQTNSADFNGTLVITLIILN